MAARLSIGKSERRNPGAIHWLLITRWLNWTAAVLLSIVLLAAGLWKLSDPASAAVRLTQAAVPASFSLAAALLLGVAETFAGVMLLVPRFRRWGALLGGALLVVFIGFIAFHYAALRGAECSCFPWIRRAVGPQFFVTDGILLLLSLLAGVGTKPSSGPGRALVLLLAIAILGGGSYARNAVSHTGTRAPDSIAGMDGHSISLREGKVFIFFFDPQCLHCLEAGRVLAALNWGTTRLIAVPTAKPQFAGWFMGKAGLSNKGLVSPEIERLRKLFPFDLPPAAVALDRGDYKAIFLRFDETEPRATLTSLGFIE